MQSKIRNNNVKIKSCKLCGSKAVKVHSDYLGFKEPDRFSIYSCTECNVSFPAPQRCPSEIYDVIYSKKEEMPGYSRYFRYSQEVLKTENPLKYLALNEPTYYAVSEALNAQGKIKKILEVGSGLGYLTYSLREAGYDAVGIDVSKVAVEESKLKYGDYYQCDDLHRHATEYQQYYDCVVATEVIEHVIDPVEFIKSMISAVRPGGTVVLTTPNKSFFPDGMVWESTQPPVHLWWFGEESMQCIAKQLNAEVSFINFSGFFQTFPMAWSKKKCLKRTLPGHVIDHNNNLVERGSADGAVNGENNKKIRDYIKKSHVASYLFDLIRRRIIKDRIVGGSRGHYQGVVLYRKLHK